MYHLQFVVYRLQVAKAIRAAAQLVQDAAGVTMVGVVYSSQSSAGMTARWGRLFCNRSRSRFRLHTSWCWWRYSRAVDYTLYPRNQAKENIAGFMQFRFTAAERPR